MHTWIVFPLWLIYYFWEFIEAAVMSFTSESCMNVQAATYYIVDNYHYTNNWACAHCVSLYDWDYKYWMCHEWKIIAPLLTPLLWPHSFKLRIFNPLLALWSSIKYQLEMYYSLRLFMICCGLWPQLIWNRTRRRWDEVCRNRNKGVKSKNIYTDILY